MFGLPFDYQEIQSNWVLKLTKEHKKMLLPLVFHSSLDYYLNKVDECRKINSINIYIKTVNKKWIRNSFEP